MDFNKIRAICSPFRMALGAILIITGIILDNYWFFLGVIPLIAGAIKFCPLCTISGKCDLPQDGEKNESN